MRLVSVIGALCAAAAVSIADPLAQSGGEVIARISDIDAIRPSEVSVAINPANPQHMLAVSLHGTRPGSPSATTDSTYVSFDSGRTWRTIPVPNDHQRVHGDDAIVMGRSGIAYQTYIAFDGIRVPRPDRASSGIFIRSSRDGVTWSDPVAVVDHINTAIPFEDKPWVAVDDSEDSPHRGNVYVAWTRFDVYGSKDPADKSNIWFARSRDGARTFTPPVKVSDKSGDARDSDDTAEGVVPSIGVNGEVYLVWAAQEQLMFDKSVDGGYSFGADKAIGRIAGGWDQPVPGIERHNGMPVTAVDRSAGANRGSLYVNWIDFRNGDADVFVMASHDGGATWSEPVRVNDDPKGNKRDQLFTWMAVDPTDGSVNVAFFDRREGNGTMNAVMLARSVDGGRSFLNSRVNRPAFPSPDPRVFYGDYIGVAAQSGRVLLAYPVVTDPAAQTMLEAAIFRFKPGSQQPSDKTP